MKVIVIFAAFLAISLAAPRDAALKSEEVVVPENIDSSDKLSEKEHSIDSKEPAVSQSSEVSKEEKIGNENSAPKAEEKVVDKVADNKEVKVEDKIDAEIETAPAAAAVQVNSEEKKTEEDTKNDEQSADDKQMDIKAYSDICRASTGATIEQIAAINENPADDAPKSVKCYVKCIAEQLGVVKDEVLQKDVAVETKSPTISTEELEEAVDTCASLKTDDPCDSSYLRYSCYFRTTGAKIRLM